MRRACILVLPLMILLLCGTGHGKEQPGDLEKRVEATEKETDDLHQRLQTLESDEGCVKRTEGEKWEDLFNDLDRRNGDQAL